MMLRCGIVLASLALLLGAGCTKREAPGGSSKKKAPPPSNEVRGDEIIIRRGKIEFVLEPSKTQESLAFAVFKVKSPARFGYDAQLELTDYLKYKKMPEDDRKVDWYPFIMVVTDEARTQLDELNEKIKKSGEPVAVQMDFRRCKVKHYTESGFRMGLPGGESTKPLVIDKIMIP